MNHVRADVHGSGPGREGGSRREGDRLKHAAGSAVASVGASDLFLFRRVRGNRFVHLGGVGRGEGWSGHAELRLDEEPAALEAFAEGRPKRLTSASPGPVVGPYFARAAAIVPLPPDGIAVFGRGDGDLDRVSDGDLVAAASAAAETIGSARKLAEELEVLHAVHAVMKVGGALAEVMDHVVHTVAASLSCELCALLLVEDEEVAVAAAGRELAADETAVRNALRFVARRAPELPLCVQTSAEDPLPGPFAPAAGVRAHLLLPVGEPPIGFLAVMHTDTAPRGFSSLCQLLGLRLGEAAAVPLRAAIGRRKLEREVERLSTEARRDSLTGLGNRLAWEEAVARQERLGGPAALMLLDLDRLKVANDERGHFFGDELLRIAARVVRDSVRDADFAARIGGDELAVLLPGAGERECVEVAERLEGALEDLGGVEGFPLSVAAGYAACPPEASLLEAQRAADALMYRRKQERRGRRRGG